jgi:hypothetical protein
VAVALVCPPGVQLYPYAGVPPEAVTLAVPVLPEQAVWVDEVIADKAEAGCVMVAIAVAVQELASVTVTV